MKYQRGDKIILLHSGEEGEIIDFINDKLVLIEAGGVQFPAYLDQIDFPYYKRFTSPGKAENSKPVRKQADEIKREPASGKYQVASGMWLAFLPVFDKDIFDDDIVEYFRLYLVNQSPVDFRFNYRLQFGGSAGFELRNTITPFADFYLHDVPFEDLNDAPKFEFDFSLLNPDKKKVSHFETSLKLKPKQVFNKIETLRLEQKAHFSYQLFESYPDKPEEPEGFNRDKLSGAGFRIYEGGKSRTPHEPTRTVVDLHIEKLTDQYKGMEPLAILDLQLKTFEKYYELAVHHHQHNLIVVHGLGSGRLRDEIHERLRRKKEVSSFVNQYHPSFGYGATEILFQYPVGK